ncbi:hypothetical protein [Vibrio vulnificus YJ016]|uniref:Uncharacterized protein n=1 Tax=Vibrio vulnificus (strain YJ016) TaxID=196600 RepID=Q7ME24_VIBVY|nr:hypothetical protein [Vibrio vulnificus YJ016]
MAVPCIKKAKRPTVAPVGLTNVVVSETTEQTRKKLLKHLSLFCDLDAVVLEKHDICIADDYGLTHFSSVNL